MGRSGLYLALVVAAAGRGDRLGSGLPKQYVPLLGIPMIQRTLDALNSCAEVDALVVVVNAEDVEYCDAQIISERVDKVLEVTAGGAERALSVRNGLKALVNIGRWDLVGVHDGARPLVTCGEIAQVIDALSADPTLDGAVLGVPSTDTMKTVDDSNLITGTPPRNYIWRAQTPQIFRWNALMEAYDQPEEVLLSATDEASLVEKRGGRVLMVQGSAENIKVTDRVDLRHAEHLLADRRR